MYYSYTTKQIAYKLEEIKIYVQHSSQQRFNQAQIEKQPKEMTKQQFG
jgi:hypothetical protein